MATTSPHLHSIPHTIRPVCLTVCIGAMHTCNARRVRYHRHIPQHPSAMHATRSTAMRLTQFSVNAPYQLYAHLCRLEWQCRCSSMRAPTESLTQPQIDIAFTAKELTLASAAT
jgi:hypothetical protein